MLIKKIVGNLYSVITLDVYEMKMHCSINEKWPADNFNILRLVSGDVSRFVKGANEIANGWVVFTDESVEKKFKEMEQCYYAVDGDSIIAFAWFAPYKVSYPTFRTKLFCKDKVLFGYNAYVRDDYRGKNVILKIYKTALDAMDRNMHFNGWIGSMLPSNVSSRTALMEYEPMLIGRIHNVLIMGILFQIAFIKKPGVRAERIGSRFYIWKNVFAKMLKRKKNYGGIYGVIG